MNLRHLIGVGLVGGIGFTMSIFIAELGFAGQPESLLMAKTGVLFASVLAGLAGYLWLVLSLLKTEPRLHRRSSGMRAIAQTSTSVVSRPVPGG
jgi:NhaA family Na+:H+ antiporter